MTGFEKIIDENKRRNAILDAPYDPILGIGGPIERHQVCFSDWESPMYFPVEMMNVPEFEYLTTFNAIRDAANYLKVSVDDLMLTITKIRFEHDPEFWFATSIHIFDKDTFEDHLLVLRGAQRKLLSVLEFMRLSGSPIRIVLLKARQWGGSTLVDLYGMYLQQIHRINWHMAICAQDDASAGNISSMYDYAVQSYPFPIGKLVPVKGSSKNRKDNIRGGRINIGSVNNPKQFRGYNNAIVHMSETGTWEDTPKRTAMEVVAALKETVPDEPYTMVVEESTAKGLNYFYDSWTKAISGETRYKGVFIPWMEIDRCRVPVYNYPSAIKAWSDYDKYQWSLGATIEGIEWYKKHKADKGYNDWQMMEENPSTPEEAFQSSGQKVFAPVYITALRQDNKDPEFIGEVYADARMGEDALKNIRFEKVQKGNLKIWKMPEYTHNDRYVVIVDIGGRTEKADNSIISVIDRVNMLLDDGYIEGILTWAGHTDQDLLAWKAAQIATMYDDALLVVESNSLKKKKEEEGDHFLTILNQIKDYYSNLYIRNDEEKVGNEFIPKYGFFTGEKSKGLAINAFNAVARERHLKDTGEGGDGYYLIEYDKEVCDEASWYETKPDGSQGAIQGKRDDRLITRAIGAHIAINKMPIPTLKVTEYKQRRKVKGYSSF